MNSPQQFQKKPVVIAAMQWDGTAESAEAVTDWVAEYRGTFVLDLGVVDGTGVPKLVLTTLEGALGVSPGDYVIRGVKNEFYPCKPDIFEMTYEVMP
jgi:hypothetical protein